MNSLQKISQFSMLMLILGACSSMQGDWPNLAEPLPDAAERERVVERANPVEPQMQETESPMTKGGAFKLLEATRANLDTAKRTYLTIKGKIAGTSGEDRQDIWNEAQLALTRLSHTVSRLDAILDKEEFENTPVWRNADDLKDEYDAYLSDERAALVKLRKK